MANVQVGTSAPRARTRPPADPARRRRRRTTIVCSRVIAPFDCLDCEAPLAIVMADHENNTYLMLGPMAKLRQGDVECECGAVREFVSMNAAPDVPRPHGVDRRPITA